MSLQEFITSTLFSNLDNLEPTVVEDSEFRIVSIAASAASMLETESSASSEAFSKLVRLVSCAIFSTTRVSASFFTSSKGGIVEKVTAGVVIMEDIELSMVVTVNNSVEDTASHIILAASSRSTSWKQ